MRGDHNLGTKNGITNILCSVLLIIFTAASAARGKLVSFAGQQNDEAARTAAERVLERAREVTRKELKNAEIKGLIVNSRTEVSEPYAEEFLKANPQYRNQRDQRTVDRELRISLPDKISDKIEMTFSSNQQVLDRTLNGDQFVQKSDVFVDGKPINFAVSNPSPKSEKERISDYKDSAFLTVFPITFDYSWHSPIGFRYIGVAEAREAKADVIETRLSDRAKYRFFFDQQTHLLLLMIETLTSKETNKDIERKYFFSDYRKEDGLLVAHKVVIETNKGVIAERELKRLQVNPTFKTDYFVIKGK